MEHRQKAQQLYLRTRTVDNEDECNEDTKKTLLEVKFYILQFLTFCSPVERYQFREYITVVEKSIAMPDFDAGKAAFAFENLELYMFLIFTYPWKQEYKELKKYAGFYQSKIDAHLKEADSIFKLIGYQELEDGVLRLSRRINKDVILAVGFECLVASIECTILKEAFEKLRDGRITYAHIYKCRCRCDGDANQLVYAVKKELGAISKVKESTLLTPDAPQVDSAVSYDGKLGTGRIATRGMCPDQKFKTLHDKTCTIPFADAEEMQRPIETFDRPEFKEGTFDEHMVASLQLVRDEKEIQKVSNEPVVMSGSDEWAYVRDNLQNKYGQSYFEGPKGDQILKDSTIISNDVYRPRPHGGNYVLGSNEVEQLSGYEKLPTVQLRKGTSKEKLHVRDSGFLSQPSASYLPSESGYTEYPNTRNGALVVGPSIPEDETMQHKPPMTYVRAEMAPSSRQSESAVPKFEPSKSLTLPSPQSAKFKLADRQLSKSMSLRRSSDYTEDNNNVVTGIPHRDASSSAQTEHLRSRLSSKVTPQLPHNFSHSAPIASREQFIRRESDLYGNFLERGHSIEHAENTDKDWWQCTHCTLMNPVSRNVCNTCDKTRSNVDAETALVTSKNCGICTYANRPNVSMCEMCQSPLSSDVQSTV